MSFYLGFDNTDLVFNTVWDLFQAVKIIRVLSPNTTIVLGCDARLFLKVEAGSHNATILRLWEEFYTDDPSDDYIALMKGANPEKMEVGSRCFGV